MGCRVGALHLRVLSCRPLRGHRTSAGAGPSSPLRAAPPWPPASLDCPAPADVTLRPRGPATDSSVPEDWRVPVHCLNTIS